LESEIIKYINSCFKNHIKACDAVKEMSAKEKKQFTEKIKLDFEPKIWIEKKLKSSPDQYSNFCELTKTHFELLELLALGVGYRKNFKQAIEEEFEYLHEHIKGLEPNDLRNWKNYIQALPSEVVDIFTFFKDEIEQGKENNSISVHLANKVENISLKAKNACVVSHASKFSHPDAKYPKIYEQCESDNDGFVRSGNAGKEFDMHINAADLQVFKLLELRINSITILDLLRNNDTKILADFFKISVETVKTWQDRFLDVFSNQDYRSNRLIKQVYFPVQDAYHQLSILTPTPVVFDLKKRLDQINTSSNKAYTGKRCKTNDKVHEGYESLFDITVQRHGGDHPKNISGLNNKHQNVYLLPSLPPTLTKQEVKLPTVDYFTNCLWPNQFKDSFDSLHKLLIVDVNNVGIRQGRDNILLFIFDRIVEKIWQIRLLESGWSERERFDRLPKYQKILLDDQYQTEREDEREWLDQFTKESARWMVNAYKKVLGKKSLALNDAEMHHIHKLITDQQEALL